MVDYLEDEIMEERKELMVSLIDEEVKPIFRVAHFLKPTISHTETLPSSPPLTLKPNISQQKNASVKIQVRGGLSYMKEWSMWVNKLKPLYKDIWEKAGIFEAILASTYKISRDNDLFIALAERWCVETNTFIFPWGEATITLEDCVVLGGYSVLGHCVLKPKIRTKDSNEIEKVLSKAPKCHRSWIEFFSGKGGDDPLEHVAFLVLWLSRYVNPTQSSNIVNKALFPIAIYLSQGKPMTLAPAVLASIYRDLRLFKQLMSSAKCKGDELNFAFRAPLQLVQLWAWERFPNLQPKPSVISSGEPRLARWHMVKRLECGDIRSVIDSEAEWFLWRPYANIKVKNWDIRKFYKDRDEYRVVGSKIGREILIFARYVRPSELVGVDCVEQYLPHRVSMQFGFDQDVPGYVNRASGSPKTAWSNYKRPIKDVKLYFPSRLFESDVSRRYLEWWKNKKSAAEDAGKCAVMNKQQSSAHERIPRTSLGHLEKINASVLSNCDEVSTVGHKQDCEIIVVESSDDDEDSITIAESFRRRLMKKEITLPGYQEPLPSAQSQSSSALDAGTARKREIMKSKPLSKKRKCSNEKSEEDEDEPYANIKMMPQEIIDYSDKSGCKLNSPDVSEVAREGTNASTRYADSSSSSCAKMSLQINKVSAEAPKVTASGTNIIEGNMKRENINNHEKGSNTNEKVDIVKLEMRIRHLENIMARKRSKNLEKMKTRGK